jgi:hypothetical protein
MSLRFISCQKGHPLLLHEGYVFRKEKETPEKIIWQCVEYKKNKCKVKLFSLYTLLGDVIVESIKDARSTLITEMLKKYIHIQNVPKVPPFLEGTSFRDGIECWKNIFKKS